MFQDDITFILRNHHKNVRLLLLLLWRIRVRMYLNAMNPFEMFPIDSIVDSNKYSLLLPITVLIRDDSLTRRLSYSLCILSQLSRHIFIHISLILFSQPSCTVFTHILWGFHRIPNTQTHTRIALNRCLCTCECISCWDLNKQIVDLDCIDILCTQKSHIDDAKKSTQFSKYVFHLWQISSSPPPPPPSSSGRENSLHQSKN